MNRDDGKKNHVDDIMNLSGGGAFGAALAAPILAPPPMPDLGGGNGETQQKGNKMLIFAILGGFGFLAVAGIVIALVLKPSGDGKMASGNGLTPSASVAMNDPANTAGANTGGIGATGTPSTPSSATSAASTTTTPPPADTTATATPPGQVTKVSAPATTGKSYGGGNTSAPTPKNNDNGSSAVAPPPTPKATGGGDINSAIAAAAGNPTPPPAAQNTGSDQPFDRGAAAAALNGVNVQGCKKPDGPTGGGHVSITFGPNGSVQSAVVDQPPFAGTPVGGCIAGKYRSAHVPPFAGSAVHAGKSFTVN